jgi:hypothetical protein
MRITGKIIFCLFLFSGTAWSQQNSNPQVPPIDDVKTTLVVDQIVETHGLREFSVETHNYDWGKPHDIAILTNVRVEMSDSFGNITQIAVGDDATTLGVVCQIAGYDYESDPRLEPFHQSATNQTSTVIRADQNGFQIASGDRIVKNIGCIRSQVKPISALKRLPPPEIVQVTLSADKLERLTLPTGKQYIRIIKPLLKLSKPILGHQTILMGPTPNESSNYQRTSNADLYCQLFGFNSYLTIEGMTSISLSNGDAFFLDFWHDSEVSTNNWAPLQSNETYFDVLTCQENP